jgi:glycosyltransferase involved in cell wall biosynthesis
MKRILFVHNKLTRFVQIDRDLLASRYSVTEYYEPNRWRVRPLNIYRAVIAHDLVFCWFASWHSFLPVLFARHIGKPSVVVVGGYDTADLPEADYGLQRGGLPRLISRKIIRDASGLVTNSLFTKEEAIANAGASPAKIATVYHGVSPASLGNLEQREPLVLTVGNISRENLLRKGLLPFIHAAAYLPHLRFVVAGQWRDTSIDELRRTARANVQFLGFLPDQDLIDLYARASVYVQASLHEGFGLSVAEAMTAGCVPVVTRAGALPEVVGDAGIYAESTSAADVASAIEQASSLGSEARLKARRQIVEHFTMEARLERLGEVIDSLLGDGGGAAGNATTKAFTTLGRSIAK